MADCRKFSQNQFYSIHNPTNGLLLRLIYAIALMFASHSSTLAMESNNTICSDTLSCTECTIKADCKWSLDQQVCVKKTQYKLDRLIVSSKKQCPRFSIVIEYYHNYYYGHLDIKQYIVNVSNVSVWFMDFLRESYIICKSTAINFYDTKLKGYSIVCSATNFRHTNIQSYEYTAFIFINLNGVMLLFDNVADHYVTVYKHKCAEDEKDKYCAKCACYNDGFAQYVKLCSSKNTCEGRKELYMRHDRIGQSWNYASPKIKDRCAEINVTAVNPLSGTQTGGTTISIYVKNHWILEENRTVVVTVAGATCNNVSTSGPETITCNTSPSGDAEYGALARPVLVEYLSPDSRLTIESSHIFQFDNSPVCGARYPFLDEDQRHSSFISGGTTVPVRGGCFVKHSPARLFVVLPNGLMQFASSYCDPPVNDTYMVCRSPRVNLTSEKRMFNFGLDFTGKQSLFVDGPSLGISVYQDPVLVDFKIDDAGSVVVNGSQLQNIQPDDVLIQFQNLTMRCVVTSVTERRFVCKPDEPIIAPQNMMVMIRDSLKYSVTNRAEANDSPVPKANDSPIPKANDSPISIVYFVILAVVMMVLFLVLACYLRKKIRSEVPKIVRDPPVVSKDLDTQTALLNC